MQYLSLIELPRLAAFQKAALAAYGERAFREYMPLSSGLDDPMILYRRFSFGPRLDVFRVDMRSFRGPNGENRQTAMGADTEFLGKTQEDDGSWHAASRSRPIQRYFETGCPHGKDQFISMSATGWATAALALACPKPQ